MAQAPAQQQQGGDNSLAPLWIIVGVAFLAWIIWYFGHAYIVAFIFKLKIFEAELLGFFTDRLADVVYYMQITPPETVSFKTLANISEAIGNYIRYPIIAILVVLAAVLYFTNPTLNFRKVYSMKSLREQELKNWPQITPVIKLDLTVTDINTGPWAMAATPMDFCVKHNLLRKDELAPPSIRHITATIKRGEAKRLFTLQLGSYWEGIDGLAPHELALFAMFAAKLNRDRDGCNDLMLQINKSSASGKLNFSGAKELAKKHIETKLVQRVLRHHGYFLTVMSTLLEKARDDGVLPSSEFLWLKPIDRRLWYMLNSVGRQTPYVEVAGPFAHWVTEKMLGRKSMVPMVDEAVNGLEKAVKEIKLTPEEVEAL